MSFGTVSETVRTRLLANWTATPIDWSAFNGPAYTPPAPSSSNPSASAWMRPSVHIGTAKRAQLGPGVNQGGNGARRRYLGDFTAQIFTPLGSGDALPLTLATTLGTLFRDFQSDGITFLEPTPIFVGSDGAWNQTNVYIPLRRDEKL